MSMVGPVMHYIDSLDGMVFCWLIDEGSIMPTNGLDKLEEKGRLAFKRDWWDQS